MKKIILLLIPILLSCNVTSKQDEEGKIKEHDYSEIKHLAINWNEMFKINESDHYVYCYSLTCFNCKSIKNQVIDKALKKESKIYFCNENLNIQDIDVSYTIGATLPENVFIRGVPSLLKINSKKISGNFLGSKNVLNELLNI